VNLVYDTETPDWLVVDYKLNIFCILLLTTDVKTDYTADLTGIGDRYEFDTWIIRY